jgi:hypothetical protein
MPTWGAVAYGVFLSALAAAAGLWLLLRERRPSVLLAGALAALVAPLAWDLILRHTGGRFFTDAPGLVFPVSYEDTGSGVFATALSSLLLGFGPLHADSRRRVALTATVCGLAALPIDIYLY